MKKVLNLVLALVLTLSVTLCLAACGSGYKDDGVFRVGIITLHDESSTYDKNFIDAAKEVKKTLNLSDEQVIIKSGIPEGNECYNEAVKLIKQGCDVIFADSFGHEDYLIKAAKKYPKVQFCHATGTQAHTAGLKNFHNAFASIYEGRYLAGVAAGIKLNAMIANHEITAEQAIIGYVGAFTYAEVMSGYTSFYLGAKSVCDSVTMKVSFTGSWYDYAKEKEIAKKLIENENCVLISQHADSQGCPEACEAAGVPNVFYNGTNEAKTTWLASSKIDWAPYFTIIMDANKQDQIPVDYTGTISTGSVKYYIDETDTDLADDLALDTDEGEGSELTYSIFNKAEADIKAGTIKVFDTNAFKVKGEKITTYMADVDTDKNFEADTEAIEGGIFTESSKRSAPYFNIEIDGITLLDRNYGD